MFLRSGTEKNWLSLSDNLFLSPVTVSEPSLCQLLSLSPLSSWLRRLDCVMNAYGTWPWIDGILLMFAVIVPLKGTLGFLMNTLPGSHMIDHSYKLYSYLEDPKEGLWNSEEQTKKRWYFQDNYGNCAFLFLFLGSPPNIHFSGCIDSVGHHTWL